MCDADRSAVQFALSWGIVPRSWCSRLSRFLLTNSSIAHNGSLYVGMSFFPPFAACLIRCASTTPLHPPLLKRRRRVLIFREGGAVLNGCAALDTKLRVIMVDTKRVAGIRPALCGQGFVPVKAQISWELCLCWCSGPVD